VGKFPIGVTFEDRGFQALTSHRRVRKLELTPIGQFSRFSFRTARSWVKSATLYSPTDLEELMVGGILGRFMLAQPANSATDMGTIAFKDFMTRWWFPFDARCLNWLSPA